MAGSVKVKDNRLKAFRKRLKPLSKGITVTVGVQGKEAEGTYKDGTPVATVAAVHEFGTQDGRIPQRSYLRSTYDANRKKYVATMAKGARKAVKGGTTAKQAAFEAGETFRADVVKTIKAGIPPPLHPATIAAKGSSVPLIDTGVLVAAISSVVHEGKK